MARQHWLRSRNSIGCRKDGVLAGRIGIIARHKPAGQIISKQWNHRLKDDPGAQAHAHGDVVEGDRCRVRDPRIVPVDIHHGDVVRRCPGIDRAVMGSPATAEIVRSEGPEKRRR